MVYSPPRGTVSLNRTFHTDHAIAASTSYETIILSTNGTVAHDSCWRTNVAVFGGVLYIKRTCFYVFINKTFLPENISSERGTGETPFIPKNSSECVAVFLSWNSFELATTGRNKRNNGRSTFCKFLSRFARFSLFFFFLKKAIYKVAKQDFYKRMNI